VPGVRNERRLVSTRLAGVAGEVRLLPGLSPRASGQDTDESGLALLRLGDRGFDELAEFAEELLAEILEGRVVLVGAAGGVDGGGECVLRLLGNGYRG